MIRSCKKCKECKVDTKVAFASELPEVVISNLNSYIDCGECSVMKCIMANEPYHNSSFFKALPRKSIKHWFDDTNYATVWYSEISALNILGYYSTHLYAFSGSSCWYDMFRCCNHCDFDREYDLQPEELRNFHSCVLDFEKSLVNKKICKCGSVVLVKGMKRHMETKKHRDWVYGYLDHLAFEAEMVELSREMEAEMVELRRELDENPNYIPIEITRI
jgi:hypothetical protein